MDVGEDRKFHLGFDLAENAQAFLQSGAAESLERGAVGLIEGSLKDVWQSRIGRDLGDFFRHGAGV